MSESTLEIELCNGPSCAISELADEVIHGTHYSRHPLDEEHTFARASLGVKLNYMGWTPSHTVSDWWFLDQPELQLESHIAFPDLAGWKREKFTEQPAEDSTIDLTPDWVCEVLTASTAPHIRSIKMPLYAELGITHFWLVDPDLQLLETYKLGDKSWILVSSIQKEEKVSALPFDSLSFPLGNLWCKERETHQI